MSSMRKRAVAVGVATGIGLALGVSGAQVASAANVMTCQAGADEPEVSGSTVLGRGSGVARPGVVAGLAVMGENVKRVHVDVFLVRFDPATGQTMNVSQAGHTVDGSVIGRLLNDTSKVEAGAAARKAGAVTPKLWHYRTKAVATCTTTGGAVVTAVDTSGETLSFIG